jgi:hypothetical protein
VHCCGGHRERCLFGHQHVWSRPWFENGRVQRLATTYHCHVCGGVCTAEEGDCDRCGAPISGAPLTQPDDRLCRRWCSDGCRDAALEEGRQRAQTRDRRENDESAHPEGMIGNPRPIASAHGKWTLTGYEEKGFACLDEACPACSAQALIISEEDAAERLTCGWREEG